MKKTLFSLSFLFISLVLSAQVKMGDVTLAESLVLKESSHDFGRIPQGKPVHHNFVVTNTGKEPLVIDNVMASCGCTTPEWSSAPVPSGKTTEIKIGYNAAAEGHFEKTITIMYNKGQTKAFAISGTVWKLQDQTAPKNNSVSLLKNVN